MILKDIVMQTDFNEMWDYLVSQYNKYEPMQWGQYDDQYQGAYLSIFERLQSIEPVESNLEIVISHPYEDDWWRVNGVDKNEEDGWYALDYLPWSEMLGMKIEKQTLTALKSHEILAHCMWEMTFWGFDEETIQERSSRISMEHDAPSIPWSEYIKQKKDTG